MGRRITPPARNAVPTHHDLGAALANAVPVRLCAARLFERVVFDQAILDQLWADDPALADFNPLDRALIRMMVATTLRRLGQIDRIIQACMNGRLPAPRGLQTVLRLSAAQILFMKIPDHAAVNLGVNLAVAMGLHRQKGLVNAVLRRLAREDRSALETDENIRPNIPDWLYTAWSETYGPETAIAIARTSLNEAPLDITLKNANAAPHWAEQLQADILPTGSLRCRDGGGSVDHLPGFAEGEWWVQDAAASLPVRLLGNIAGQHVIDLCAAPGGKAAQLAAAGAHVTAIDRNPERLNILQQNMTRLGLAQAVTTIVADGTIFRPDTPADLVLLDAPCTATGTLRRNPDILHHRAPADVIRQASLQRQLLHNAVHMLRPGGHLLYIVCSLQPEEGEAQIANFLKEQPKITAIPFAPDALGGLDHLLNSHGMLRICPHHLGDQGGIDGFFAALLRFSG